MKVGLFWDEAINISSYYVKDGTGYNYFTNEPYLYHHSVSPQCYPSTHNFTFLWGNGSFLNLSEWDELPDLDLDLVFYACERSGLEDEHYDRYCVSRIRDKYKDVKVIGYLKEVYVKEHRFENRIKFLNECDFIHAEAASRMKTLDEFLKIEKLTGRKINFTNQPVNINYMFDNFYSNEKENSIFAYLPAPIHRRGKTYEFANHIGDKYNINVKYKSLEHGQKFDYLSQKEFVELWSPSLYHFNLDPINIHPGGQCIQVASVGSIHIGGVNESHHILYPDTATCDVKVLEDVIDGYIKDEIKRFSAIEYAWEKVNENFSFNKVKNQIESLYGE